SGLGLRADETALRAGLAMAGVPLEAISALVLTHAHPDHIGIAHRIHAKSGAPIYMLPDEAETLYTVWDRGFDGAVARLADWYASNGLAPTEASLDTGVGTSFVGAGTGGAENATATPMLPIRLPPRAAIHPVAEGQDLRLGRWSYHVYWTPGHADHHLCLLREDGLFFAGDHILPRITPNIGLYPHARPNPLGDYYASLGLVRDLPARLTLPGHGLPFAALAQRVDELRRHHEERSATVARLLTEASGQRQTRDGVDGATVARALFGGRLHTRDDERFALVETLAHLEYLYLAGKADRSEQDGPRRYCAN
ncbi:MAG: MBL fold metallo-hydrolase, partial [Ktedonobacterales bacterium]